MNSKLVLGVIVAVMITITLGSGTMVLPSYATAASDAARKIKEYESAERYEREAPSVITGDNVYITWFTNEGTVNSNYEVGFRASNDSGATFGPITNVSNTDNSDSINAEISAEGGNLIGPITNISNTDNSDSINAEISAEGGNIIVSYWEKNQTSMLPFARVSTDNGQTFGDRLNITANGFGSIGSAAEGEE